MPVINRIAAFHEDMTAWRHDLHANPELSMHEARTSAMVREKLVFSVPRLVEVEYVNPLRLKYWSVWVT